MPICYLRTNMKSFETKNAEERLAKFIVDTFGVPKEVVFVMTQFDMPVHMAGSKDPGLVCEISARKVFQDPEKAKTYFEPIFKELKEITKLKGNRILVHLVHIHDDRVAIGQ